ARASSCAWARCRRSTIRTSSSISATTTRSSAPTARRSTGTIRRSIRTPRARPNAPTRRPRPERRTRNLSARTIIVAGAGIGGLTAALALAQKGFRVELIDQAGRLEETGAGIQLSPNATRVLIGLGLHDALLPAVVVPEELNIKSSRGRAIARMPLG